MTFTRLKMLIMNGTYNREDMLGKMDVFLMAGRISNEQYTELLKMMGTAETEG